MKNFGDVFQLSQRWAASVLLGLLRLILCCLDRRRAPAAGLKRIDPLPGRGRPYFEIRRCDKK